MNGIYLGLGSNLGDRLMNLACCLKKMKLNNAIRLIKVSSVYESEPYGFANQPWFLNMVAEIETKLEPLQLLELIQQIENQSGRKKTLRWGPRTIDIDLLNYKNLVYKHPMLNLPHRQLHLRQFVLQPLKEIASRFVHPELQQTISQLLKNCQDKTKVNWFLDGYELLNSKE